MKLVQLATVIGLASTAALSAHAAFTVTHTDIKSYSTVGLFAPHNGTVALPKFNSSLGLLTGVTVTLEVNTGGSPFLVSADNDNATGTLVPAGTNHTAFLVTFAGGVATVTNVATASSYDWNLSTSLNLGADDGDAPNAYNVGGADHATFDSGAITKNTSGSLVAPGDIASYAGVGDFFITLNGAVNSGVQTTAGVSSSVTTPTMFLVGSVTYSYIPEPSSFAGFTGLAALGCVALRRRRRA